MICYQIVNDISVGTALTTYISIFNRLHVISIVFNIMREYIRIRTSYRFSESGDVFSIVMNEMGGGFEWDGGAAL